MATEEQDREDLLRDATTMPLRAQTVIDDITVVVGFRGDGQLSLYCGPDPVFQFNQVRELRRVFYDRERYAADSGRLIKLTRESRGGRVEFLREPIDSCLEASILGELSAWMEKLRSALAIQQWEHTDSESDENKAAFMEQLNAWLSAIRQTPKIAKTANA